VKPPWLPEAANTNGEWDSVLAKLYEVFRRDFQEANPTLDGLPLHWDSRSSEKGFPESFWHLITRIDPVTRQRLFDPRRAERLPWCAAVIRNAASPEVKRWVYWQRGQRRLYLWLEDLDYVVVLEPQPKRSPQRFFLVTASHLDGPSQRRAMRRRYENREA